MKVLHVTQSLEATNELYSIACGPDNQVHTYTGCIVNGGCFHTKIVLIDISPKIVAYLFLGSMTVKRLIFMVSYQMWPF